MDTAANNFSYSAGGVAFAGTTVSTVLWVKSQLPETRMKKLDDVFDHTMQTYEKSDAEGLLPNDFKLHVAVRLANLGRLREEARERTYRAITLFEQIKGFLQGLSGQIMQIEDKTKQVRAQVVTKSEESRRSREASNVGSASPADAQSLGASSAISADGARAPMPLTEPVIPPIIYCQLSSSQVTLVQSIALTSRVQPCSQITVEDASQADTPKPCSFASAMWSRLMEWRSPSLQPPNDIEAGTRDMGVST